MATNTSVTVTTSSTTIPIVAPATFIHVTNMGVNPITLRVGESGSAVF